MAKTSLEGDIHALFIKYHHSPSPSNPNLGDAGKHECHPQICGLVWNTFGAWGRKKHMWSVVGRGMREIAGISGRYPN